jgi:hypothetical protein
MNYDAIVVQKELRSLLVNYGIEVVNLEWVKLLTTLESQIKSALKKEVVVVAPVTTPIPVATPVSTSIPETTPTPETPVGDKRVAHKNAILKKREELTKQGINGHSLLSEANLKQWVNDGKTYWKIAEETGVWDAEISSLAKSYGVQSEVSKFIGLKKKK